MDLWSRRKVSDNRSCRMCRSDSSSRCQGCGPQRVLQLVREEAKTSSPKPLEGRINRPRFEVRSFWVVRNSPHEEPVEAGEVAAVVRELIPCDFHSWPDTRTGPTFYSLPCSNRCARLEIANLFFCLRARFGFGRSYFQNA